MLRVSDTVRSFSTMADSTIKLYSIGTPNGQKVRCTLRCFFQALVHAPPITKFPLSDAPYWQIGIALEEMGLQYEAHSIDIRKGDQLKPEFLAINPNGKIPAIVDPSMKGPGKYCSEIGVYVLAFNFDARCVHHV